MAVSVAERAPRPAELRIVPLPAPIVEAVEVQKTYDTGKLQVHALRAISFSVNRGEMVSIMGPSGSGKTTRRHLLVQSVTS